METWIKSVILFALLIGMASFLIVSVYYGVSIKPEFEDWHYPTTVAFLSSSAAVACGVSYLYLTARYFSTKKAR